MRFNKIITSIVLIASMAISICSCGLPTDITLKRFKDTVIRNSGVDKAAIEDRTIHRDDVQGIYYKSDPYAFAFIDCADEKYSKYEFLDIKYDLEFYQAHDDVEGTIFSSDNFIVFDAEFYAHVGDDSHYLYYLYGGAYLIDNVCLYIYTFSESGRDKRVIDSILDELGLPQP